MPSAFAHAFSAYAFNHTMSDTFRQPKVWIAGIFCAAIPDVDVISFSLGIPYESLWGHRGMTHSLLFSFLLALVVALIFFRKRSGKNQLIIALYLGICGASHGLLDAMTTGGKGIALFAPWDQERYFLPWKVIQVSPIGIEKFFSEWGLRVIISEFIWVGIPCLLIIGFAKLMRRRKTNTGSI